MAGHPSADVPRPLALAARLSRGLVRALGVVVAPEERREWREEWDAELACRVRELHRGGVRWAGPRIVFEASGALADAFWYLCDEWSLETMWQDVRHGLRTLGRKPLFTALAILTLALAIGAVTAIYTVVDGVLIKPLPYPEPDRLAELWEQNAERDWYQNSVSGANFLDWREQAESFEDMAGFFSGWRPLSLTGYGGDARKVTVQTASENFFDVLGVQPLHGSDFPPGSTWDGGEETVVLSYGFFRRVFGGDPKIVGRTVEISKTPCVVAGVMPPGFSYPDPEVDAWMAFGWDPEVRGQTWFRRAHFLRVVGRLKAGVTPAAAEAELQTIARRLEKEYPDTNQGMGAGATPLHEWVVGDTRPVLWLLLGAVGLVMLVACSNVVNLLLVQAGGRAREMAVRSALGAGRRRLMRLLMTENALVVLAAGVGGAWIGRAAVQALVALKPDVPRLNELTLDAGVFAATVAVTLVTTLGVGLVPALAGARVDLRSSLHSGERGSAGRGHRRLRRLLVVGEVALALVLVAGAGALGHSFYRLYQVDPGFDPQRLLTVRLTLPSTVYDGPEAVNAFYGELVERVRALDGVTAAATGDNVPILGSPWTGDFTVEGSEEGYGVEAQFIRTSPGYFEALGMRWVAGRDFDGRDQEGAEEVAIVSESLARRYLPDQDPIGRRIAFDREITPETTWRTIVGVTSDLRYNGLRTEAPLMVYRPSAQHSRGQSSRELVVRTAGDPSAALPAIRSIVQAMDGDVPIMEAQPMADAVANSLGRERFVLLLLLAFGAVTLFLAALGVYGVLAVAVQQRRREIGIRMALGADAGRILGHVVREGAVLIVLGSVAGLGLSVLLTRYLGSLLYEVRAIDPLSLAAGTAVLASAAFAASLVPALRAARIDPVTTLGSE